MKRTGKKNEHFYFPGFKPFYKIYPLKSLVELFEILHISYVRCKCHWAFESISDENLILTIVISFYWSCFICGFLKKHFDIIDVKNNWKSKLNKETGKLNSRLLYFWVIICLQWECCEQVSFMSSILFLAKIYLYDE